MAVCLSLLVCSLMHLGFWKIRRIKKRRTISIAQVRAFSHLSAADAAARLGLGPTTFKVRLQLADLGHSVCRLPPGSE